MTRRKKSGRSKKQPPSSAEILSRWGKRLVSSPAQQVLALVLIVLALLTLLTLLRVTSGRWTDAWVLWLRQLFGWGIVPVAIAIGGGGVLILQHHLDQPIAWRWRPVVGLEVVFFSMLALTHLLIGQADPWGLIESGWGGGAVGWALSHALSYYLGPWVAGLLLAAIQIVGLGMTFDLTMDDVKRWVTRVRSPARSAASAPAQKAASHASRRPEPKRTSAPPETRPSTPVPSRTQQAPRASVVQQQPTAQARPPAVEPEPIPFGTEVLPKDLQFPSLDLLNDADGVSLTDEEVREKSRIIVDTLAQFGLPVQVVEVRRGPAVTQFGIAPGYTERTRSDGERRQHKVRVSQIANLSDDLALALAAPSLRVEAPVPGRSVVGIEVPNEETSLVTLRLVMESKEFAARDAPLTIALGEDVAGSPVVADLALMPHLLVAGTTGSGKSVCIKALATCLALTNRPDELRMVMIDPKMVELVRFNGLPHLLGHTEVELERIVRVLRWVAHEMDERYKRFSAVSARHLDDFNAKMERRQAQEKLPRIVVLIDELADLMMLAPEETERTICRIAQMARATGIHLVVATQRPSTDVVTGLIKANFPARISFSTASQIDSRVILDQPGAETLLGRGDMLFLSSDASHPVRVQGCFVSDGEIGYIVESWRQQAPEWPSEAPWEQMMRGSGDSTGDESEEEENDLLDRAASLARKRRTISASYLQRQLRVGYPRAARLMEQLEAMGLVGPPEAAGRSRRVIGGEGDDADGG